MLVLSRGKGQRIRIGEDITLTVVEIRGDKIRLGIEAPRTIDVHRDEIYCRIHGIEMPATGQSDDAQEKPKSEAVFKPVLPPRL